MNEVAEELHSMTGTQQRVTSAYHLQSNGLVERQNRTIKNALVKILDQNPEKWPYIIDDVLFAHRVSCHASTNCSPFCNVQYKKRSFPEITCCKIDFLLHKFSVIQSMSTLEQLAPIY